jgi:coenzyme F420-dependent glucose-6-phosphate dehydrogenase
MAWPPIKERRLRLAEAIKLMRQLWSHERVDFAGDYYRTERVTIYDRPEEPVPIYVAAAGPLAAKLAGRVGDGFITTSGKGTDRCRELLGKVDEGARGAGRDPGVVDRMIEIKISYDEDLAAARKGCNWWGALALSQEEKSGVEDPMELERLADASPASAETRFICTNDPDEAAARVQDYVDLGFTHLVFHSPGADQKRALELLARDVLPRLRAHAQAIHAAGQPISTMSSSQPA